MSAEPHLALLSFSRWRMRSSAFLQYSLWLDFLPSSWASFLLCPTRPPRHHPERSRRLLSLCAVRYMHLPSMIEKSLDYMSAFWGNWLKFIDLCVFFLCIFQSAPALDVSAVLTSCVRRKRTVLTVPWLVEFLSMLDYTGPFLPCYRTALGLLLQIYRFVTCNRYDGFCICKCSKRMCVCVRRMRLGKVGEQCYLNQMLLVAVLGWLFQVRTHTKMTWNAHEQGSTQDETNIHTIWLQIPVFPEDLFFSINVQELENLENHNSSQGLVSKCHYFSHQNL